MAKVNIMAMSAKNTIQYIRLQLLIWHLAQTSFVVSAYNT